MLLKYTYNISKEVDNQNNHYANTPMQYIVIFHGCKNVNFQMKIFNIFLIFARNIDCGYTLEPLTSTHNLCFRAKIRKLCIPL